MGWATIRESEKLRLRVKARRWCQIEITIQAGCLSICGAVGEVISRREVLPDDEVCMVNSHHVFIVSGCGQITDDLKQFFPECIPHLRFHMQRIVEIPKPTVKWANSFCSSKQMEQIQKWRYNAAEYCEARESA